MKIFKTSLFLSFFFFCTNAEEGLPRNLSNDLTSDTESWQTQKAKNEEEPHSQELYQTSHHVPYHNFEEAESTPQELLNGRAIHNDKHSENVNEASLEIRRVEAAHRLSSRTGLNGEESERNENKRFGDNDKFANGFQRPETEENPINSERSRDFSRRGIDTIRERPSEGILSNDNESPRSKADFRGNGHLDRTGDSRRRDNLERSVFSDQFHREFLERPNTESGFSPKSHRDPHFEVRKNSQDNDHLQRKFTMNIGPKEGKNPSSEREELWRSSESNVERQFGRKTEDVEQYGRRPNSKNNLRLSNSRQTRPERDEQSQDPNNQKPEIVDLGKEN